MRLVNARPGTGTVKTANGQLEKIVEEGDLGPLKGARKVNGFSRTLVSVSEVTKQIGNVLFTPKAGFVIAVRDDGSLVATQIATATAQGLYKFDLSGLQRHVDLHGVK